MELSRQKWEGVDWLTLLAILVVAVILRCYPLHENVWVDELHTAWAALADDAQFGERVRLGNNGPAYFLFVRAVTQSLGMHEWTLRLVSVVSGIALIPVTFRLCRIWNCSVEASLLAASLVAIDRNAVFYSVEARPYVCVQLLSVVHLLLFSRLLLQKHHVWVWIAWILTGIFMFHLHCTSALIFPAEVVAYAILWTRRFETNLHWIYFTLGLVVILAGTIPAIGLIREVSSRRENWEQFVPRTRNPLRILTIFPVTYYLITPLVIWLLSVIVRRLQIRTTDDESQTELESDETGEMLAGTVKRNLEFRIVLVIGLCWLLVPLLLAFVLTERDVVRLFYARYLVAASVALAPLTALIATRFLRGRRLAVLGALGIFVLGALTISSAKYYRLGTQALAHSQENWKSPVGILQSDDAPVVLYSKLMEATHWYDSDDPAKREFCELPVRSIYSVDAEREVIPLPCRTPLALSEKTVSQIQSMADRETDGFWLLMRGDRKLASDVQGELLKVLGGEFRVLDTRSFGTKVHLRRLGRQT